MSASRSRTAALLLALLACPATPFAAPIGVTSASDGDPLGKPPNAAERVLHVGIDVQASELVTTGRDDRAQLLFLDGTSLTVGPNAEMRIDRFVFDPASSTGELGVSLGKGVLRMVGGKISKNKPVTVTTPGGTVGIRGGIAIINAQPAQTTAVFMFGRDLTFTGQGVTQTVTRPGFEIVQRAGAAPQSPMPVSEQALNAQIQQLEGRRNAQGGAVPGGAATVVKVNQGVQGVANQQPAPRPPGGGAPPQQPPGWQQWGGGVAYQNPTAINPAIAGNNITLVPGGVASASQLPNTGTATYNGSFSVGQSQVGPFSGSVNMGWNFASQSGTFTATANGLNTAATGTATGPVSLVQGTAKFSGTLTSGSIGANKISVGGNFLNTSGSPVGAIGGTLTGTNNQNQVITGTFNATR
ncbi:MAG: FecR domain-containing protein [Proteobacteria bacterium]|nr:FecR domain-containing protein [Pseudomonadota bacterium]